MKARRTHCKSRQVRLYSPFQDFHLQSDNLHNQTKEDGELEKNESKEAATKNIQNINYAHKRIKKSTWDQQTDFVGDEHDMDYATRKRVT